MKAIGLFTVVLAMLIVICAVSVVALYQSVEWVMRW